MAKLGYPGLGILSLLPSMVERRSYAALEILFPLPYPPRAERILKSIDLRDHLDICLFGKCHFESPVVLVCLAPGSQRLSLTGSLCWTTESTASSVIPENTQFEPGTGICFLAAASVDSCACNFMDGHRGEEEGCEPHSGPAGHWWPCLFGHVLFEPLMIRM